MNLGQAWKVLGLARTADTGAIRRAYADRLRAMDIDREAQAYAQLRDARDMALRWARQQGEGAAPVLPDPVEPAPLPAPAAGQAWPYGAPTAPAGTGGEPALSVPAPGDAAFGMMWRWPALGAERGTLVDLPLPEGDPFAVPGQHDADTAPPPPASDAVRIERGRDRALYALLLDDEEALEVPLSADEAAQAQDHLSSILRDAEAATLAQQEAVEDWLANTLARAWPRSAPLLAPASAFFEWEREAGKINERPAVSYLNARLKGLRFYDKVQDPAHPLHKAWKELERPGEAGLLRGLRASHNDVQQLIEGVRKNFPELEHYWDSDRVGSWERAIEGSTSPGSAWGGAFRWIIVAVVVIRILAGIGDHSRENRNPDGLVPQVLASESTDPAGDQKAIDQAFGPGKSLEWLRTKQPELASTISYNQRAWRKSGESQEEIERRTTNIVRERIYFNGRDLAGADLVTTMQLRLAQLQAARKVGVAACSQLLRQGTFDPAMTLSDAVREQERRFAVALAESGQLGLPKGRKAAVSATVPGDLIDRTMTASGLGEERLRAAMQGKGSDAESCAMRIGLLRATLAWKGPERAAILKTF